MTTYQISLRRENQCFSSFNQALKVLPHDDDVEIKTQTAIFPVYSFLSWKISLYQLLLRFIE